jgi:hypothetical protein
MRNQKIIEFQSRLRYKKLVADAGVGQITDFKYGTLNDSISRSIKSFSLRSSDPYNKIDRSSDDLLLKNWFYRNARLVIGDSHDVWVITSGDIAWVNIRLLNPVTDLFNLWLASSKNLSGVTKDFKCCFDFSTYEYEYEFHKKEIEAEKVLGHPS